MKYTIRIKSQEIEGLSEDDMEKAYDLLDELGISVEIEEEDEEILEAEYEEELRQMNAAYRRYRGY